MNNLRRSLVVAIVAAAALVALPATAGAGLDPTLTVTPPTGPPGTVVTVSGSDCITKGATTVLVWLFDSQGVEIDNAIVPVVYEDFSGDWETTFTIPPGATDIGTWTIEAMCVLDFGEEFEDVLFDYDPGTFVLTAPPVAPVAPPVDAAPALTG